MRKVELTVNEQKKYETIKRLVEKGGSKKRAALKLGVTVRTINRLIKRYKLEGKSAFSHKNKARTPSNAFSAEFENEIITLYLNKYSDANFKHFSELLARVDYFRYFIERSLFLLYAQYHEREENQ